MRLVIVLPQRKTVRHDYTAATRIPAQRRAWRWERDIDHTKPETWEPGRWRSRPASQACTLLLSSKHISSRTGTRDNIQKKYAVAANNNRKPPRQEHGQTNSMPTRPRLTRVALLAMRSPPIACNVVATTRRVSFQPREQAKGNANCFRIRTHRQKSEPCAALAETDAMTLTTMQILNHTKRFRMSTISQKYTNCA